MAARCARRSNLARLPHPCPHPNAIPPTRHPNQPSRPRCRHRARADPQGRPAPATLPRALGEVRAPGATAETWLWRGGEGHVPPPGGHRPRIHPRPCSARREERPAESPGHPLWPRLRRASPPPPRAARPAETRSHLALHGRRRDAQFCPPEEPPAAGATLGGPLPMPIAAASAGPIPDGRDGPRIQSGCGPLEPLQGPAEGDSQASQ